MINQAINCNQGLKLLKKTHRVCIIIITWYWRIDIIINNNTFTILTCCIRLLRYDIKRSLGSPVIPFCSSLSSKIWCGTVSKALAKSKNTVIHFRRILTSMTMWSTTLISASLVPQFLLKPSYWLESKIYFFL